MSVSPAVDTRNMGFNESAFEDIHPSSLLDGKDSTMLVALALLPKT